LHYLYKSDYEEQRRRNPQREKGTCEWFFHHKKYQLWFQEQKSSLLWLSADPGCGKSVIAASIVDQLQNAEPLDGRPTTVCFFFFKDDNDNQKSATLALCALIHQILTTHPVLIKYAKMEFDRKGQNFAQEFGTLWNILMTVLKEPGHNLICVLDGLDECEESTRDMLIKQLSTFYSKSGGAEAESSFLKVIVTSRPYRPIEVGFHELPTIRLKAEDDITATSQDIELVVKARVKRLTSKMQATDLDRMSTLENKLVSKADHTFIWVSLILNILEKSIEESSDSEDEFAQIVDNLPPDMDTVYEKILRRSPNPQKARRMLHIVVAAARPLTLEEMNIALAILPTHSSLGDVKRRMLPSMESSIKGLCGLFVRVIDSKIYLVHQTAKEFLCAESTTCVPSLEGWKHSLVPTESNQILAEICLLYLLLDYFEHLSGFAQLGEYGLISPKSLPPFFVKYPLLEYSGKYWPSHFTLGCIQDPRILDLVMRVCDTEHERFSVWIRVYHWSPQYGCFVPKFNRLGISSYLGHAAVVKLLLERSDIQVNLRSYGSKTPLHIAALGGHEAIVKLLLERSDIQVNLRSYGSKTPLHIAALGGHEAIVKLLLERSDIQVNLQEDDDQTPLYIAASRGHEAIVKLLLEQDNIEVDLKDKRSQTPLSIAIATDQQGIIKLLEDYMSTSRTDSTCRS
jgi:hypothetical protein